MVLVRQICEQLTRLLSLSACRYQEGAAGVGRPPRLLRDGRVVAGDRAWDTAREGLPRGVDTELLVEPAACFRAAFC